MLFNKKSWNKLGYALLCLFQMNILSCGSMGKRINPSDYFVGNQLLLANAIRAREMDTIKRLIPQTDLNTPAKEDMTILFFALFETSNSKDPKSYEILTELVKAGADAVNHEVPPSQNGFYLGSVWGLTLVRGNLTAIQALLDGGVHPDASCDGKTGSPSLFSVADEAHFETLKFLISRGANINLKDTLGNSLLSESMNGWQLDQTLYLLKQGTNPSTVNRLGVSFAWQLKSQIEKAANPETANKLDEIKALAIFKGMSWPPNAPVEERDKMRARGETPVVPYGMTK